MFHNKTFEISSSGKRLFTSEVVCIYFSGKIPDPTHNVENLRIRNFRLQLATHRHRNFSGSLLGNLTTTQLRDIIKEAHTHLYDNMSALRSVSKWFCCTEEKMGISLCFYAGVREWAYVHRFFLHSERHNRVHINNSRGASSINKTIIRSFNCWMLSSIRSRALSLRWYAIWISQPQYSINFCTRECHEEKSVYIYIWIWNMICFFFSLLYYSSSICCVH